MKNKKLIAFVVVLVTVSLSCNYLFPTSTNKTSSNSPVVDFVTAAKPLNVTVQLDDKSTASNMITPAGGSLSLTAKDGTVFTLDVPAKALAADTLITMTAVKSITGAPLDKGPLAAIKLEPSGLVFSGVLTLTIVPAKEIPIKNQIIFGYEGNGQDYHLAVVDPKSKEIKIKLIEFSGAGVGSGGDAQWAANLQIQANASSTRLMEKLGEAAQTDRKDNVLVEGDKSSNELGNILESILDQYYDQVAVKEMAAAELDCQYAKKAMEDLIKVESLRQNLLYTDGKVTIPDLSGKLEKLSKIKEKCKKSFHISGAFGDMGLVEGNACDVTKPFTLHGPVTIVFTPTDEKSGSFKFADGPFADRGAGPYTIGNGSLLISGSGCVDTSLGTFCNKGSLTFTVTPIDPASCVP